MAPELGIIEGFYGPRWSWAERAKVVEALAPQGYGFYLYAPKADAFLRRRWNEAHPAAEMGALTAFAALCREHGMRFGVGLSPFEIFNRFDESARSALADKLCALDAIGIDELALLFDDMRSETPQLAARQVDIVAWVAARTKAARISMCPTYYSADPVLDRVFGARPAEYLETLGAALDPAVNVFWTGEEVCSREITPGHLTRVADVLRRKPLLWDNYPVNDGERMSCHLHLRAFTGRHEGNACWLAGHAINPALQPTLSLIPALTLAERYRLGADYAYGEAFFRAARAVLGDELARCVRDDLLSLQDTGLQRLSEPRRTALRERYAGFAHPGAQEIVRWLDGAYQVTDEMVETQ